MTTSKERIDLENSLMIAAPHVLVMEDEPDLNDLYSNVVKRSGYTVSCAKSVREAQELLKLHQFDMILGDIRMGDGLGTDVLRDHKADLDRQGTQVIMISAEPQYINWCEDMGIEYFMVKPISVKALMHLIKRLLPRN